MNRAGVTARQNAGVGARVLVTRAREQAQPLVAALRAEGLEPLPVPAIAVVLEPGGGALDAASRRLSDVAWVFVTSANGARAIVAVARRTAAPLHAPRWAAVGAATAAVLERAGIGVAFQPTASSGMALGMELPLAAGEAILLVRGDLATDDLPARLRSRGAGVTEVVGYRTQEAPAASRPLLRRAFAGGPPAAAVLASGSGARGLAALASAEGLDATAVPTVCIGPETALEAGRLGFEVLAVSHAADARSIAAATAAALREPLEIR